jgi:hypothetical protein
MSLILFVSTLSLPGCASRGAGGRGGTMRGNGLLAVDTLWSTGGRATGPATRTPAGGPGRSRVV